MQPHTAKQEALEAIQRLPDSVDLDEIVYRLYVLNKIQQGMQDAEAGRTITSKELLQEIEQW
jgi:predicted transcriptional regulator